MCAPSWFNISATSSLFTAPSLSRSSIWKPSRICLTCAGCSCDSALSCATADACDAVDPTDAL